MGKDFFARQNLRPLLRPPPDVGIWTYFVGIEHIFVGIDGIVHIFVGIVGIAHIFVGITGIVHNLVGIAIITLDKISSVYPCITYNKLWLLHTLIHSCVGGGVKNRSSKSYYRKSSDTEIVSNNQVQVWQVISRYNAASNREINIQSRKVNGYLFDGTCIKYYGFRLFVCLL